MPPCRARTETFVFPFAGWADARARLPVTRDFMVGLFSSLGFGWAVKVLSHVTCFRFWATSYRGVGCRMVTNRDEQFRAYATCVILSYSF